MDGSAVVKKMTKVDAKSAANTGGKLVLHQFTFVATQPQTAYVCNNYFLSHKKTTKVNRNAIKGVKTNSTTHRR